ncbi:ferredoxin [Actinomadura algeriensis]|uniref:Ferredoxin n=1 Tax=Actinomadura algeriensis TaxID=1679523 RepID=A0ABR9K282_9ACTN|nr:ferredoxin [Actinomadura algeriensis]MBE1536964.1 ferredoxin [Actinomadura algeriensis]
MRLSIDADRCMGHGRCYSMAEGLLSDDEEGFVAERGRVIEVPAELLADAREAAAACPEGAIALLDSASAADA